jgi:cytochrome P450
MGWIFMRLAFDQAVQQRLYEESCKFDDLIDVVQETAPYNYAVIYEVLRLHPAVTTLPLKVRENVTVCGDLELEKGWSFNIHVGIAGMNEKSFDNPAQFRPERFLDADGKFSTQSASILSFNVGPRACIGKQVALMEISITIAQILKHYTVEPVWSFEKCSEWTSRVTREFAQPTPFRFVARK